MTTNEKVTDKKKRETKQKNQDMKNKNQSPQIMTHMVLLL